MSGVELEFVEVEAGTDINYSVIWLHGLGADGHDFKPIVPHLGVDEFGVRFIFPHASVIPITVNGGMPMRAWYDIDSLDLDSRDVGDHVFASAQQHVRSLIKQENDRGIPTSHIILAGFSQGGAVTLYSSLRYPETLLGILAISTYLPSPERVGDTQHSANQSTSIFMAHGSHDDMIDIRHSIKSRTALEGLSNPLEWHEYPMGHEVCPEEIAAMGTWFRQRFESQR